MRWTSTYRHNLRSVEDKFNLYNQVIERNHLKMRGTGTPCTYYKNTAFDDLGNFNKEATKCYCYSMQPNGSVAQPDPRHSVCQGTGVLSGYQRYGYSESVFATTSIGVNLAMTSEVGFSLENGQNKSFILNAGATQGDITTSAIPLIRFQGFDRFYVRDSADVVNNKVEYYYSLNGTTWNPITLTAYTGNNNLATFQGTNIVIPAGSAQIFFRARLRKKVSTAQSPIFNHFRFRYKQMPSLVSIDNRYKIQTPAFLASREQETSFIEQGKFGWETRFPLRWWTLPEVNINNHDVLEFHNGIYAHKKFLVDNVVRNTHGPELLLTHTSFETVIIRDETDLKGVLYYLT